MKRHLINNVLAKMGRKCLWCGKEHENKKFCSKKCLAFYRSRILKDNPFFDSKIQSKISARPHPNARVPKSIRACLFCKKDFMCYGSAKTKFCCMLCKYDYDSARGYGTFCIPEVYKKARKNCREKRNIYINGSFFDSKGEAEIGLCISKQFGIKLKDNINMHILFGKKEIDFYIKEFDCFIEYHPTQHWYKETSSGYISKRRFILEQHKLNSNLIVII